MKPVCQFALFDPNVTLTDGETGESYRFADQCPCAVRSCREVGRVYVAEPGEPADSYPDCEEFGGDYEDLGAWLCVKHLVQYIDRGIPFGTDANKWAMEYVELPSRTLAGGEGGQDSATASR